MPCRSFIIAGRVQGVWFRASTRDKATSLGLVGRADNLPDGRVKVIACGDSVALEQLQRWLWQGPPLAHVDSVDVTELAAQDFDGFSTGTAIGP